MDDTISRQTAIDAGVKTEQADKQKDEDRQFVKLTVRNSNGKPYYSIIYLVFDDNGIGHDMEGYSSYSLDVISDFLKQYFGFAPPAQPDLSAYSDRLWKAAYERGKAVVEPRWIPVTERLPKPYEYCLWTTTDGRVIYHHCDGLFSNYIAWMPLPKPYERSEK